MNGLLSPEQLTGQDETHLVGLPCGNLLAPPAAQAIAALQADARRAGFDLVIASGFRSFARQLAIFNGKASGRRPVHDDAGVQVDLARLPAAEQLRAILRYSALPGASRHHWGTDVDIFDAAAVGGDYQLQLSVAEVAPGGVFDPLHSWLDERIAAGESHGFHRPYARDRGGVAPERWHLSYAPLSRQCSAQLSTALLRRCWAGSGLLLQAEIEAGLPAIFERYIAVPDDWCPAD